MNGFGHQSSDMDICLMLSQTEVSQLHFQNKHVVFQIIFSYVLPVPFHFQNMLSV